MKRLLLFYIYLIVNNLSYAQLLKTKSNHTYNFELQPIDNSYLNLRKLYVLSSSSQSNAYFRSITEKINTDYYKLTTKRDSSELVIRYRTDHEVFMPLKTVSETKSTTKKDGTIVTTTTYTATSSDRVNCRIELLSKTGDVIFSSNESLRFEVKTSKQSTEIRARQVWEETRKRDIVSNTNKILEITFERLEAQNLLAKKRIVFTAVTPKSRKSDYTDMKEAAELVGIWMESNSTDLSDPGIQRAITLYEQALVEFEPNKKSRINPKVAAVCYLELASIQFKLKNYAKANEFIQKSTSNFNLAYDVQYEIEKYCRLLKNRGVY